MAKEKRATFIDSVALVRSHGASIGGGEMMVALAVTVKNRTTETASRGNKFRWFIADVSMKRPQRRIVRTDRTLSARASSMRNHFYRCPATRCIEEVCELCVRDTAAYITARYALFAPVTHRRMFFKVSREGKKR